MVPLIGILLMVQLCFSQVVIIPEPNSVLPTHPFPVPLTRDSVVTACNHQVKNCSVSVLAMAGHILHVLKANPSQILLLHYFYG